MTLKLNGTNSEAAPAYAGDDADTGLQCGTNELKLVTGGTARATVASSGKFGIGTDNPGQHLTIKRTGGQTQVSLISDTDQSGAIYFGDTASTARGVIEYNHTGDYMRFYTSGSERVRIHGDGTLAVPNGILLDPGQLSGSATNILDEYEEGDWTPTITFGGNNSGMGFTSRDGFYIKIGRQVTCWFQITLSSKGSSTGVAKIDNLPFDADDELSGTSIEGGGLLTYAANINNTVRPPYAIAVLNNTNEAEFITSPDSNEQGSNLTNSHFSNNTLIRGYFTYFSA